jgi:hypothetical protein
MSATTLTKRTQRFLCEYLPEGEFGQKFDVLTFQINPGVMLVRSLDAQSNNVKLDTDEFLDGIIEEIKKLKSTEFKKVPHHGQRTE